MIRRVEITRRVEKQVRRLPARVGEKLSHWVYLVMEIGLEEVRRIPGFHDEPLVGRRRGMRSVRLSRAYRALYRVVPEGDIEVVCVEEVSKHGY
jgi:proteic killer suppression protein